MISFVLFFQASQRGMKLKNWSVCFPAVERDCIAVENSPCLRVFISGYAYSVKIFLLLL